ncbi:MAG: hypothetical protein KY469_17555 [Actinobacteria bacterium]|nr:hypothetical protein [Actinomycetota bacterium]
MRRLLLSAFIVTALFAAGCGDADDGVAPDPTETATATPAPTVAPTETVAPTVEPTATTPTEPTLAMTTCEADRFSIDHPRDWATNTGDAPPCRAFHPDEFGQIENEALHYAVRLYIDPVEFDRVANSDEQHEIVTREDTEVDGHRAILEERVESGQGLAPEGTRTYVYVIEVNPEETMIVATYSIGDTDYERDKDVMDRMVDSLVFLA